MLNKNKDQQIKESSTSQRKHKKNGTKPGDFKISITRVKIIWCSGILIRHAMYLKPLQAPILLSVRYERNYR